jgi:hypothetical protein
MHDRGKREMPDLQVCLADSGNAILQKGVR